jgi:hypothetical protein
LGDCIENIFVLAKLLFFLVGWNLVLDPDFSKCLANSSSISLSVSVFLSEELEDFLSNS